MKDETTNINGVDVMRRISEYDYNDDVVESYLHEWIVNNQVIAKVIECISDYEDSTWVVSDEFFVLPEKVQKHIALELMKALHNGG